MEIEFIAEEKDYSVAKFFETFHAHLPTVVKVNQGFQGHIIEDTFSKGEILYIAAVSKQKRVMAEVHSGHRRHRIVSFPAAFSDNLCVVKRGKCCPESSLSDILHHYRLPVNVQFPPNDIILMGGKRLSSKQLPAMKLLKTFEEIYLLGNLLTNGRLDNTVLHVPVYLSQLRLCLVTGVKYLSASGWDKHLNDLEEESRKLKYDLLFGSQYIAEYDPEEIHLDKKYEFVEPVKYDAIFNLVLHWPECDFLSSSRDDHVRVGASETNTEEHVSFSENTSTNGCSSKTETDVGGRKSETNQVQINETRNCSSGEKNAPKSQENETVDPDKHENEQD